MCGYSFATIEMSHNRDKHIGYVEISLGIGDMMGPSIGGIAFYSFGFSGTFFIFSTMILVGLIISKGLIPGYLNKKISEKA